MNDPLPLDHLQYRVELRSPGEWWRKDFWFGDERQAQESADEAMKHLLLDAVRVVQLRRNGERFERTGRVLTRDRAGQWQEASHAG